MASRATSHRIATLAALALGLLAPPAGAQSLSSGVLEGVVRDFATLPVNGARVVVRHLASGLVRSTATSRPGRFSFELLPPGEYALLVERSGLRPHRVEGISVRPGERVDLVIRPASASGVVQSIDTLRHAGSLALRRVAGGRSWIPRSLFSELPGGVHDLGALHNLSSRIDGELGMAGLPARMTTLQVDGAPVAVGTGGPDADLLRRSILPLGGLQDVEILSGLPDVEADDRGAGVLATHTRPGSSGLSIGGYGAWSGDAVATGTPLPPFRSIRAGLLLSGSIVPDTASFSLGVEARRFARPTGWRWGDAALAGRASAVAMDSFGIQLPGETLSLEEHEVVSAFGRVDWQMGGSNLLTLRASAASLSNPHGTLRPPPSLGQSRPYDAQAVSSAITLASRLGAGLHQETRIGFNGDVRTAGLDPGGVASTTRIPAGGLLFGFEDGYWDRVRRSSLWASEVLLARLSQHLLKVGASIAVNSFDHSAPLAGRAEFTFADVDGFTSRSGKFVQTVGPARGTSFALGRFALFAQDTWTPEPGLSLLLGARYHLDRLPQGQIALDQRWLDQTGIDNSVLSRTRGRILPRVSVTWDLQDRHQWVLRASAGLYSADLDAELLHEVQTFDGGLSARRALGPLGRWPAAPDSTVAPVGGSLLTLLAPGFTSPRTLRADLGADWLLGRWGVVGLSVLYRHTDLLPRRADLNLHPDPVLIDQYGRPLHGTLRQEGGFLAVLDGSNRRFPDFDHVYALNADGWSTYQGIHVGGEIRPGRGLGLLADYTYSRTWDNWPGATSRSAEAELVPAFPSAPRWAEARSDLDVPHRLVAGIDARLPLLHGARLLALYRYRSGYPFTPGFRDGVDANADGSGRNDPAFVDPALRGTDRLLSRWSCLRRQAGAFAGRNSCRTEGTRALDLRLSAALLRFGGYRAELVIDAVNLLASETIYPDQALLLVDRGESLVIDPRSGTARVPFAVNENFGESLVRLRDQRLVYLGIRVNY